MPSASEIAHEGLPFVNPLHPARVDAMVERLELPAGARVLDVGCGRGELLARIAARWGAECVGVDLSGRAGPIRRTSTRSAAPRRTS